MVPTVYAAVSLGIILFLSSVTAPHKGPRYVYSNYNNSGSQVRLVTGFPIGLAIFGALALTTTTTATAILSSMFLGTNTNNKIQV